MLYSVAISLCYNVNILSVQHIYDQKARQVKTLTIDLLDENNINEYHH